MRAIVPKVKDNAARYSANLSAAKRPPVVVTVTVPPPVSYIPTICGDDNTNSGAFAVTRTLRQMRAPSASVAAICKTTSPTNSA